MYDLRIFNFPPTQPCTHPPKQFLNACMADFWSLRIRLENLPLKVHIDFPLRQETASRAFQPLIVVTVKVRPPSDSLVYFGHTMFIRLSALLTYSLNILG